MHTSNLFHTEPQAQLAKRLCETSFADRVFYCNSGTEANEGAIKFARKVDAPECSSRHMREQLRYYNSSYRPFRTFSPPPPPDCP